MLLLIKVSDFCRASFLKQCLNIDMLFPKWNIGTNETILDSLLLISDPPNSQ